MVLDRVRTAAALLLLACLALPTYTCDGSGYVGPRGETMEQVPDRADPAAYPRTREPHYAFEAMYTPPGLLVLLAFTWPVPFFIYRRRRAPAPMAGWVHLALSPVRGDFRVHHLFAGDGGAAGHRRIPRADRGRCASCRRPRGVVDASGERQAR